MYFVTKFRICAKKFCLDYAFRSEILLFFSILADLVFGLYYASLLVGQRADLWCCGLFAFYLLLVIVRITLLSSYEKDKRRKEKYLFELTTGVVLLLLGAEIGILAITAWYYGVLISIPSAVVIANTAVVMFANGFFLNLLYVFFKFIFPFLGKKRMRERSLRSSFFRCKKYLTRSESLFVLVMLLSKLIVQFGEPTSKKILFHLCAFLAVSAFALICGIDLLVRAYRRQKIRLHDEPAITNR